MPAGKLITWTSALSSLVVFTTAVGLALHVRLGLGHWPKPMWEEYRTLAFDLHSLTLMGASLFALFAAVPLWVVCVCLPRLRLPHRTHFLQAGLYLVGWSLVAAFILFDPHQFITWLMD